MQEDHTYAARLQAFHSDDQLGERIGNPNYAILDSLDNGYYNMYVSDDYVEISAAPQQVSPEVVYVYGGGWGGYYGGYYNYYYDPFYYNDGYMRGGNVK